MVDELVEAVPRLARKPGTAREVLQDRDCNLHEESCLQTPCGNTTSNLVVSQVQKNLCASLLADLPREDGVATRGNVGPGAAGFLAYSSEPVC